MLVTKVSVLLQGLADNSFEFWGNVGIDPDRRHGHFFKNRIKDDTGTLTTEWQSTCCHFVEHDTKRKQVCPSIQILRPNLLWRHIRNCPQRATGACQVVQVHILRGQSWTITRDSLSRNDLSKTKVENLSVPTFGNKDVRWFDVAVDNSLCVCRIQPPG